MPTEQRSRHGISLAVLFKVHRYLSQADKYLCACSCVILSIQHLLRCRRFFLSMPSSLLRAAAHTASFGNTVPLVHKWHFPPPYRSTYSSFACLIRWTSDHVSLSRRGEGGEGYSLIRCLPSSFDHLPRIRFHTKHCIVKGTRCGKMRAKHFPYLKSPLVSLVLAAKQSLCQ